ncbi:MAG: CopG family transcriptional regulator [Proteobacteria bacterium]|nr:CopG family transcriptional regulator [Pseudomonadota bacterium]
MARLTLTLDDALYQALQATAARQGRTLGQIVAESLRMRGIKPTSDARALVAQARRNAALDEPAALALAVAHSRAARS